MTRSHINRGSAALLTAAMAVGTAGPAAAQPIGSHGPVPVAPPMKVQQHDTAGVPAPSAPGHMRAFPEATPAPVTGTPVATAGHPVPGGSPELVYIVVGGVVIALGGLGTTLAVAGRRRTVAPRPRIAA